MRKSLSKNLAKLGKNEYFNHNVAVKNDLRDYENKKVLFTFKEYIHSQCEIHNLQKQESKNLTETLKKINHTEARDLRQGQVSGITCKSIINAGDYASLFSGLTKDIDLLEIYYSGTGRIIGYLTENIFYITSVLKKHRKY
jgi:hypothetical protein